MTKHSPNAAVAYEAASAKVAAALLQLESKLKNHRMTFVADGSKNWGFVGDLNHYASVLYEIASTDGLYPTTNRHGKVVRVSVPKSGEEL